MALMQANLHLKALSVTEGLLEQTVQDKLNQIAGLASEQQNILSIMSTDSERAAAVAALTTAFETADQTLEGAITQAVNTVTTAVGTEKDRAEAAEAVLTTAVSDAVAGYQAAIANVTTAYTAAIATEATDRAAGDTALQSAIDSVVSDVTALTTRVTQNEADIVQLKADVITNGNAIAAEKARAEGVEAGLQSAIDSNTSGVSDNAAAITAESTRAAGIEAGLQAAINALAAGSKLLRFALVGAVDDANKVFTLPANIDQATFLETMLDGRAVDDTDGVSYDGSGTVTFTTAPNAGAAVTGKGYPN